MNVNRKSWHAQLFSWTYTFWDGWEPRQTSLCHYVHRIFWGTLLTSLFVLCIGSAFIIAVGFATTFAFIGGFRPALLKGDNRDLPFIKYKGLFGWLYPWHMLLVAGLILLEWGSWKYFSSGALYVHLVLLAVVIFTGVIYYLRSGSETARLMRAWISAKKNKICPLVTFSEEPTSEE